MAKFHRGLNFSILTVFFLVILCGIFTGLLVLSNTINKTYFTVQSYIQQNTLCRQASETIKDVSSTLSEKANYFVLTHNPQYADEYIQLKFFNTDREEALKELYSVSGKESTINLRLKIAVEQAESQSQIELYAMRLAYEASGIREIPFEIASVQIRPADFKSTPEEMQALAVNVLFNDAYGIYRERVSLNCSDIILELENSIQEKLDEESVHLRNSLTISHLLQALLILLCITFFAILIHTIIQPLRSYSHSIQKKEHLQVSGALELKYLAETYNRVHDYDPLTKVLNRRGFAGVCDESRRKKEQIGFMLIDIDDFKGINDTYGHSTGDMILERTASLLSTEFRKNDSVARIGGDEFAVLISGFSIDEASVIEKKIHEINDILGRYKDVKGVSISAGVAFSSKGYSKELYEKADKTLYRIKNSTKCGLGICQELI